MKNVPTKDDDLDDFDDDEFKNAPQV